MENGCRRTMARNRFALLIPLLLLLPLLAEAFVLPAAAAAAVPYDTMSKDAYGRAVPTQPAYIPDGVIGESLKLNQPQDLYIDRLGHIFVLDTGNARIVHLDGRGRFIREIRVEESPLSQPQGIFVTREGDIYVADTGNRRVVKLDAQGKLVREYPRPESALLPADFQYEPVKVIADRRGFLYIVSRGSYRGLVQLDAEGAFHSFFAGNRTEATWLDILKRMLYTEEQLSREVRLLPDAIANAEIDETGFVYTATSGAGSEQLKKFNIGGVNRLPKKPYGEAPEGRRNAAELVDVTVHPGGFMTTVERGSNTFSHYDAAGNLLFYWRGIEQPGSVRAGVPQSVSALGNDGGSLLYALDPSQNLIHVYRLSAFGRLVHEAVRLTRDGRYAESEPLWREAARLNANFAPAYHGMGIAAYRRGDYGEAMRLFQEAGDSRGYSDALWQVRLQWFQRYFPWLANGAVAASLLLLALSKLRRKRSRSRIAPETAHGPAPSAAHAFFASPAAQLRHAFAILKKPIDGFADLRYGGKGGYAGAALLLAGVIVSLLVKPVYTGFSFQTGPADAMRSSAVLIQFGAVFGSWVVCNYLISSIRQGEGRFRDVFIGSVYSLFPVVLLAVPVTLLSRVMTLSEASIYGFLNGLMIGWCALLFFWQVQSVQNYTVSETMSNLALSVLAMAGLWGAAFILFGIASEFVRFVDTVLREAAMR